MNDQAWLEGQKNGRIDRLRGATVGHVRMRGHCENSKLDTESNLPKTRLCRHLSAMPVFRSLAEDIERCEQLDE
jgi:hypothetical protein